MRPEHRRIPARWQVSSRVLRALVAAVCATCGHASSPAYDGPIPSLDLCLLAPEQQWLEITNLLKGTPHRDPAQLLAAWKRANPARRLNKSFEALLASLNNQAAFSLRPLDKAWIHLESLPGEGISWRATLIDEAGIASDLLTALAMSEGEARPAIGATNVQPIERIGTPGTALFARDLSKLAIASDNDQLHHALGEPLPTFTPRFTSHAGGLLAAVTLGPLAADSPIGLRRIQAGLLALGLTDIQVEAGVLGSTLRADLHLPITIQTAIDREWLDTVPASADVLLCTAIDPSPAAWTLGFEIADRIEKADQEALERPPLRARLTLLAHASGIRLDRDVFPFIRGISLALDVSPGRRLNGVRVVVHASDAKWVERITEKLDSMFPANARLAGLPGPSIKGAGQNLTLDWGTHDLVRTHEDSTHLRSRLDSAWNQGPPSRLAWIRPSILLELAGYAPDESIDSAADPILWHGRSTADGTIERIEWTRLDRIARALADLSASP